VSAERLLGLLAHSCGWIDRCAPVTARDLVPLFRRDAIPTQPLVLTPQLLGTIGYPQKRLGSRSDFSC
jgi:glutamyl-tRNA synthetase